MQAGRRATPTTRRYLAYKLWSYFIPTPPSKAAMQMMVANYKASGYNAEAGAAA